MKTIPASAVVVLVALLVAAGPSHAHGGGTNAEGCHNNRSTGDYHCHGGKSPPAPRASLYGAQPASAASSASYANCSEARAAGAAPVRRGQPGYGSHLDRDDDGVGCE